MSLVFPNPLRQITRYADVKRPVNLTCEYIDVASFIHNNWAPAYAGATLILWLPDNSGPRQR